MSITALARLSGDQLTAATSDADDLRTLVARVAAAYFSCRPVPANDVGDVIGKVATALSAVDGSAPAAPAGPALTAAEIRRSITPAALISFEDGRPYKTLARHLRARGLTPADYRRKWGLPPDYPMTAEAYSATRSGLAKRMNLTELGVRARKSRNAKPD